MKNAQKKTRNYKKVVYVTHSDMSDLFLQVAGSKNDYTMVVFGNEIRWHYGDED